MKNFFLLVFAWFFGFSASGQTLNVTVTGIRNTKGSIILQFFSNSEAFEERKAVFTRVVPKSAVKYGTLSVSYTDIPKGHYGIALLDDENNSKDMDYGVMLPKEGFGFSNYYHKGMSKPEFGQFDFYLQGEPKYIKIQVRYM